VYVAGPYTADPEPATARAIEVGNLVLDAGHAPFVPHLHHYWHTLHGERAYHDWMRIDLAWLDTAHALIRIPGESHGAEQEVACAEIVGIPVHMLVSDEQCRRFLEKVASAMLRLAQQPEAG
jgi:hypothetical protein